MKDQRKSELKVGITIFFAIILLILIIGWAKNLSLYATRNYIDIKFQNVSGLEIGDNVTVSGVRKGYVDNIVLKEQYIIVTVSIETDVILKEDARFYVSMLDLMGGKKVEIEPGISANNLDLKKTQVGLYLTDISSALASVGTLTDELPILINKINIAIDGINTYLTDKNLQTDIKSAVNNLASVSSELRLLLNNNSKNIDKLIAESNNLVENSNSLLKNNSESITKTVENAEKLIAKSDTLISGINRIVLETKNRENNIGKLLYDENLLSELDSTMKNIKELINVINDQIKNEGVNVKAKIKIF